VQITLAIVKSSLTIGKQILAVYLSGKMEKALTIVKLFKSSFVSECFKIATAGLCFPGNCKKLLENWKNFPGRIFVRENGKGPDYREVI